MKLIGRVLSIDDVMTKKCGSRVYRITIAGCAEEITFTAGEHERIPAVGSNILIMTGTGIHEHHAMKVVLDVPEHIKCESK